MGAEEDGSGGEVGDVDESVGDSFQDGRFPVGAFDPAVGGSVSGVVEGEDLVAPFDEGPYEFVEFDQWCLLVDVDEGSDPTLTRESRSAWSGERG